MTAGDDWLLDLVDVDFMPPAPYARVHPAVHPATGDPLDPLAANPNTRARFALHSRLAPGAPDRAMVYFATTPAGALFEALLRADHCTWYGPKALGAPGWRFAGQCLSFATLRRPLPVLAVGLPDRARLVQTPWREARWRELLSTGDHADTHAAAAALYDQVTASGRPHHGLTWSSIQQPSASVYLLYQPPYDAGDWIPEDTIALDTPRGQQRIANWLKAAGYTWFGDPSVGLVPDPGVL